MVSFQITHRGRDVWGLIPTLDEYRTVLTYSLTYLL